MKQAIKIVLPAYKIFYSLFFPVVLCLIRGVARADEIGGALDSNMALLSLVFCAETWVMERSGRRWEIFTLYPVKNRTKTVLRRLAAALLFMRAFLRGIFLLLLAEARRSVGKNGGGPLRKLYSGNHGHSDFLWRIVDDLVQSVSKPVGRDWRLLPAVADAVLHVR